MRSTFPTPDARIRCAADFVRPGARFADVGCDHGYLSVYLCSRDAAARGIASDLRPSPLARAAEHLRRYGFADRVQTRLADGLSGMEGEGLDTVCVLGMGGETIAGILEHAPFTRSPSVRLILQPMTQADALRRFLYENGYAIEDERLAAAHGKVYAVLCACYSGARTAETQAGLLLGRANINRHGDALFAAYLHTRLAACRKRLHGLRRGDCDTAEVQALYDELYAIARAHGIAGEEGQEA